MFPPFPEDEAYRLCKKIAKSLEENEIRIEHTGRISEERAGAGIMIGALICTDKDGKKVNLASLSGTSRKFVSGSPTADSIPDSIQGFIPVPCIVPPEKIDAALEKNDAEIHRLTKVLEEETDAEKRNEILRERKKLTDESLAKVHALYSFRCIDGTKKSLTEICRKRGIGLPPTGTGECAEVKLLHYAFENGLQPVSMAEMYWGKSTAKKECGKIYPPCDERCALILPEMLGLEIIYRDSSIVVVNKQSGLLSIPGRTEDKKDCITSRLKRLFPECIDQPAVHRLDMETSGLMVLALTKDAHRRLSMDFEQGKVKKEYEALLDGILAKKGIAQQGCMELYFRLDVDNRPHQIWDEVYGKKAITEWKILNVETFTTRQGERRNATRVRFIPHTGRTHQLRLASADPHGFGIPIIGDSLYGPNPEKAADESRLLLHAAYLSFTHPETGETMIFESPCPF